MIFLTLTVENFLAIQKVEVPLHDRGLVLIQGINDDDPSASSNGAAKSSIFEAISWLLFNRTARGMTGDAVVHRKTKKDARVSLEVAEQDTRYRITRYRKHSKGSNRLELEKREGDAWVDLTLGTDKLTQEAVERLVGCSYEVFKAAVYAGQEAFPDLPGMTDKELKVLIEESAGIERLQQAYEVARKRWNEAKQACKSKEHVVESLRQKAMQIQSQIDEARANESKWRMQVQATIKQYNNAQKEIQSKIQAESENAMRYDEQALKKIEDGLEKIQSKLGAFAQAQQNVAKKQQEFFEASKYVDQIEAALKIEKRALSDIENELLKANSKVGSPCEACGKTIEPKDVMAVVKSLAQKRTDQLCKVQELLSELELAQRKQQQAQESLKTAKDDVPDVDRLVSTQNQLVEVKKSLNEQHQTIQRLKSEIDALERQKEAKLQEESPFVGFLGSLKQQAKKTEEESEAASQEWTSALSSLQVMMNAVEAFSPAGVRAQVLDTVTPFLNEKTAEYLSALSDGNIQAEWQTLSKNKKNELKEKFNIAVESSTGGDSFKALSGGEKRKVRLATALALADLVASRASKPLPLFIADEIDDAVDQSGLERLMNVLEQKAKERGTLLIISHNDLAGYVRETMTIRKSDGFANLVGL